MRIHSITNWEIRGSLTINMWELWTERGGTWYLHEVNKSPSNLIKIAKTL